MFKDYSRSFKVNLLHFMESIVVKNGEQLYTEGDSVENFYLIISGEFRTSRKLQEVSEYPFN